MILSISYDTDGARCTSTIRGEVVVFDVLFGSAALMFVVTTHDVLFGQRWDMWFERTNIHTR